MRFAQVESGVVVNVIEAEPEIAGELGALPYYDGCGIGGLYSPPHTPTDLERCEQHITDLELDSIALGQQVTELELMILGGGTDNV